jgi:hypothetical protein
LSIWPGGKLSIHEFADLSVVAGKAFLNGTLEFVPATPFNPQLNEEFEILTAAAGVAGTFHSAILPTLESGLAWTIRYAPTSVSLVIVPDLPGDYNHNGIVDAADYVVWRDTLGETVLWKGEAADGDRSGTIDLGDYEFWKLHFGEVIAASASSAAVAVPEPGICCLIASTAALLFASPRRVACLRRHTA